MKETTNGSIMVVDDTSYNLNLFGQILKNAKYNVSLIPNGSLTITSALVEPPGLKEH